MSKFTNESWQEFLAELQESHDKHSCSTSEPIWMVQELKRTYGMDSDYSDQSVWVVDNESKYKTAQELFESLDASDQHKVNEFCLEQSEVLFDDLDGFVFSQDEMLEDFDAKYGCNWSRYYYVEKWVTVQAFITRHDADRFIKKQSHNYGELRVYVESMWRSPQLGNLIQAVLDGELKLVKGDAT